MDIKKLIKELIPYIIIIIIVLLVRRFVFSTILVNGPSMEGTLYDGDFMILDKISYKFSDIKRYDIVVVQTADEKIIKRVMGLPGETIEYKDGVLYINDIETEDNYGSTETQDFGPIKIKDNQYFVMGDNRRVSHDSRYADIGPIDKEDIIGKTYLILFPFNHFGFRN